MGPFAWWLDYWAGVMDACAVHLLVRTPMDGGQKPAGSEARILR